MGREHAYPTAADFLASGRLDAIGDVLRSVLSGAYVASALAIGASGCGTPAQASVPQAAAATLAPATPTPNAPTSPNVATIVPLPLPPPPPMPGATEDLPCSTPPSHVPPNGRPQHLGGHIAAVHPHPPPARGGMRSVNATNNPLDGL